MTARYTYAEFQAAGLKPQECDGNPYEHKDGKYWFACDYHEGYIDGYTEAKWLTAVMPFLSDDQ